MARGPLSAVAAAAFAGSSVILLQWITEERGDNRDAAYRDMVTGSRLLILFLLILTALLNHRQVGRAASLIGLGSTVAFRLLHGVIKAPKAAAPVGAGIIMLEAFAFGLASHFLR